MTPSHDWQLMVQSLAKLKAVIAAADSQTLIIDDDHEKQTILMSQEQMSTLQKWMGRM